MRVVWILREVYIKMRQDLRETGRSKRRFETSLTKNGRSLELNDVYFKMREVWDKLRGVREFKRSLRKTGRSLEKLKEVRENLIDE